MSSLMIQDLSHSCELDHHAMSAVVGGAATTTSAAALANVNVIVDVSQNLYQNQNVQVNALNNVGSIGPNFMAPSFMVAPDQIGGLRAM
jgi:hypothetical protein